MSDQLYQAALRLRKGKPWEKMGDNHLFAIQIDEETYYCYVTGMAGADLALYVLPGQAGLDSYRRLWRFSYGGMQRDVPLSDVIADRIGFACCFRDRDEMPEDDLAAVREWSRQNNVRMAGSSAFPLFIAWHPGCAPVHLLTDKEEAVLIMAMDAALSLAKHPDERLNRYDNEQDAILTMYPMADGTFERTLDPLPSEMPPAYPTPRLNNDLMAARVRHTRKNGTYECATTWLTADAEVKEGGLYPYALFIQDVTNDLLLEPIVCDRISDCGNMLIQLANGLLTEEEAPRTIRVSDDRTEAMLRTFCEQTGITLSRVKRSDEMIHFIEDYLEDIEDDDEDEDMPDYIPSFSEFLDQATFFSGIGEELSQQTLKAMPEHIREIMRLMAQMGLLSNKAHTNLRRAGIL